MFVSNAVPDQVVILCPGPGEADPRVPPALLHVGGVPFLRHVLASIKRNRIADVILVTAAGGAAIEKAIGDGRSFGLRLRYFHDPEGRHGSGGALREIEAMLRPSFFVLAGDRYLLIDFEAVGAAFVQHGLPSLMTVWRSIEPLQPANCLLGKDDDGRPIVARYHHDARQGMRHAEYGVSVLRDDLLSLIPDGYSPIEALHQRNALKRRIAAYEASRRFYDVSNPNGLRELRDALLSGAAPSHIHLL